MTDARVRAAVRQMADVVELTDDFTSSISEAVRKRQAKRRAVLGGGAVALLAVVGMSGALILGSPDAGKSPTDAAAKASFGPITPPPQDSTPVVGVEGLELFASETAEDWTGNADHVVVGTVTSERAEPVSEASATRAGEGLIGRYVTIKVDGRLWANPRPASGVPVPDRLTVDAFGWVIRSGGVKARMAERGASRLEVGHRYVIALRWMDSSCDDRGHAVPARWGVLGSGGVVPFDSQLGVGEVAGRTVAKEEVEATGLRRAVAGKGIDAVAAALQQATPRTREHVKRLSVSCAP